MFWTLPAPASSAAYPPILRVSILAAYGNLDKGCPLIDVTKILTTRFLVAFAADFQGLTLVEPLLDPLIHDMHGATTFGAYSGLSVLVNSCSTKECGLKKFQHQAREFRILSSVHNLGAASVTSPVEAPRIVYSAIDNEVLS